MNDCLKCAKFINNEEIIGFYCCYDCGVKDVEEERAMLKKIKPILAVIGIKRVNQVEILNQPKITHEDTRTIEAAKRIRAHLIANHELIVARGMRPHTFDCEDNDICDKDNCWKWEPDKIVGEPYKVCVKTLRKLDGK